MISSELLEHSGHLGIGIYFFLFVIYLLMNIEVILRTKDCRKILWEDMKRNKTRSVSLKEFAQFRWGDRHIHTSNKSETILT